MVPKLDHRLLLEAAKVENHYARDEYRDYTNAICKEALQHIDVTMAYLANGLIGDENRILRKLIYQGKSKKAFVENLTAFLINLKKSNDPKITMLLNDFR